MVSITIYVFLAIIFLKLHIIFPLVSKEALVIANQIKIHVFLYFGLLKIIHSYNGSEMVNVIIALF